MYCHRDELLVLPTEFERKPEPCFEIRPEPVRMPGGSSVRGKTTGGGATACPLRGLACRRGSRSCRASPVPRARVADRSGRDFEWPKTWARDACEDSVELPLSERNGNQSFGKHSFPHGSRDPRGIRLPVIVEHHHSTRTQHQLRGNRITMHVLVQVRGIDVHESGRLRLNVIEDNRARTLNNLGQLGVERQAFRSIVASSRPERPLASLRFAASKSAVAPNRSTTTNRSASRM